MSPSPKSARERRQRVIMQLGVLEKNTSPSRPPRGVLPPWQVGRWGLCPGSPLLLTPTLPRPRQDIASLAFPERSQSRGRRCCPREPRPASSRTQKIPARDPARAGSLFIARDPDSAPTAPRGRRARPRAKRSRGRCGASWPDSRVGVGVGGREGKSELEGPESHHGPHAPPRAKTGGTRFHEQWLLLHRAGRSRRSTAT